MPKFPKSPFSLVLAASVCRAPVRIYDDDDDGDGDDHMETLVSD